VHIDPLMTSAWNASLRGHKRWVLFGEGVPKSIAKGREFRDKSYDDESINYFVEILPLIKEKYSRETLQIIEFIQGPGETVFVPGGLWHAVVNLDDTIAVTQNVVTHYCFNKVWQVTRSERKKFAESFLEDLQRQVRN
jgi:histone arginine demethylase JMJD6